MNINRRSTMPKRKKFSKKFSKPFDEIEAEFQKWCDKYNKQ